MATRREIWITYDSETDQYQLELLVAFLDELGVPTAGFVAFRSAWHFTDEDALAEWNALQEREADGPVQDVLPAPSEPWWAAIDAAAVAGQLAQPQTPAAVEMLPEPVAAAV